MRFSRLFFLSFFLFPFSGHATSLQSVVDTIIRLDQKIEATQNVDLLAVLDEQREKLLYDASILQKKIATGLTSKATTDRTLEYRLVIQKYSLSCEIAALRAVLETVLGRIVSEDQIFADMPQYQGARKDGIWGDPEIEFVGDIRGAQKNLTGFGVYEFPLAKYFSGKGIKTWIYRETDGREWKANDRLQFVLESLDEGFHVILWGDYCTLASEEDGLLSRTDATVSKYLGIGSKNQCLQPSEKRWVSWKTPEGKAVRALVGEHAFVLLGYHGTAENPTHVVVWDTNTGKHTYTTREWMRKWSLLEYRTLVVDKKVSKK